MKQKLFKTIFLTLISGVFIFLAYGSGENSRKKLSEYTKEEIIEVLCEKELTDNFDDSAGTGLLTYEISLQMSKNGTFKYSIIENKDQGSYKNSISATGTFKLIGGVTENSVPSGVDKYGQQGDDIQNYTQLIEFSGKTNEGRNFSLMGSLTHLTDKYGSMENYLLFSSENRAISIDMHTSLNNYRLPTDKIYP